jgi:uncharacterized protein (DUF4415 family)
MNITRKRLEEIMTSKNIDFSDSSPLKKRIKVQLDDDILVWLKSAGRSYQARMNAILREAMEKSVS